MKKLLLGTAAMIAFAAPAIAADLAARALHQGSAPIRRRKRSTTGPASISAAMSAARSRGNNSLQGSDGRFLGGVQGGFDYQFATNWVIGAEAQYSWLANSNNGVLFPGAARS